MDRRGFLKFFSAGVAGIALEQAIPLGRVWSFPKEIVVPKLSEQEFAFQKLNQVIDDWGQRSQFIMPGLEIGDIVTFADWPGRFVVSQVRGEGKVQLWSAEQKLVIRGVESSKLTAAFPPDSSGT